MIFIEQKYIKSGSEKVKYEFTYLDYLYYCDKENWKRIVNGYYPISDEEDDFICVKEKSTEYIVEASRTEERRKNRR